MSKTIPKQRIVFAALLGSILIDFMGAGIVLPLLPFYAKFFGASPFEIGLLFGLSPLIGIFAPLLWGNLSDRMGRRIVLLFNIACTTLAFLWLSFANSLGMLFMARFLTGVSSGSIVIAQAYTLDLSTLDNRTKNLSLLEAASCIGFAIGPLIGGLLVGSDSANPNFRLPGLVSAITCGLTFFLALITLPQSGSRGLSPKTQTYFSPQLFLGELNQTLQRPLIKSMLLLVFMMMLVTVGCQVISPLWYEIRLGWGPQEVGYYAVFSIFLIAITQIGLTSKLIRWLGEVKLLLWSLSTFAVGLLFVPFLTTVPQVITVLPLFVFSQATFKPAFTSLLSQLSGVKRQGKTLGLMQSVIGLASFLGAIGAGFLWGALDENWPYWIGAMLMIVGIILFLQKITQSRFSAVERRRRQQKLLHFFELLDHDKSGTLELKDFQQAAQTLATLKGFSPKMVEYETLQISLVSFGNMLLTLADRDSNQQIDQAEWLQALEHRIDYDFANLFLQIMDTNQDGNVTIEELKIFYQAYGIQTEALAEVFSNIDLNQDKYISLEELEIIFTQFLYSDDIHAPGNWIFGARLPNKL